MPGDQKKKKSLNKLTLVPRVSIFGICVVKNTMRSHSDLDSIFVTAQNQLNSIENLFSARTG